MEWADSLVWRAILASNAATTDSRLREQLLHLHLTQRGFFLVWTNQDLASFWTRRFDTTEALFGWARPLYSDLTELVSRLDRVQLEAQTPLPWAMHFAPSPGPTTLGDTLFQLTSHTTHHRGQVNSRLRELGAEPPLVDYIAWLWLGKPPATWL